MRVLAALLTVFCATLVALAVFVLRALDGCGVELAGVMLTAMGVPRAARSVVVVVGEAPTHGAAGGRIRLAGVPSLSTLTTLTHASRSPRVAGDTGN